MGVSNVARTAMVSAVIAVGAFGCGGSGSSVDPVGPTRLQIDTQGGHFDGPFPVLLEAYLYTAAPTYMLSIGAGKEQTSWNALLYLSRDEALAGHASVPITMDVLSEGHGSVQVTGSAPAMASSGTLDFSLAGGRASGSAQVAPSALSGSFDGELSVDCWVPPSHLPPSASSGGTVPTDGSEALIVDRGFTTPECQPFRALVPGT